MNIRNMAESANLSINHCILDFDEDPIKPLDVKND